MPKIKCFKCQLLNPNKPTKSCIACSGKGILQPPAFVCPKCNGSGNYENDVCNLCVGCGFTKQKYMRCDGCGGKKRKCKVCHGNWFIIDVTETIEEQEKESENDKSDIKKSTDTLNEKSKFDDKKKKESDIKLEDKITSSDKKETILDDKLRARNDEIKIEVNDYEESNKENSEIHVEENNENNEDHPEQNLEKINEKIRDKESSNNLKKNSNQKVPEPESKFRKSQLVNLISQDKEDQIEDNPLAKNNYIEDNQDNQENPYLNTISNKIMNTDSNLNQDDYKGDNEYNNEDENENDDKLNDENDEELNPDSINITDPNFNYYKKENQVTISSNLSIHEFKKENDESDEQNEQESKKISSKKNKSSPNRIKIIEDDDDALACTGTFKDEIKNAFQYDRGTISDNKDNTISNNSGINNINTGKYSNNNLNNANTLTNRIGEDIKEEEDDYYNNNPIATNSSINMNNQIINTSIFNRFDMTYTQSEINESQLDYTINDETKKSFINSRKLQNKEDEVRDPKKDLLDSRTILENSSVRINGLDENLQKNTEDNQQKDALELFSNCKELNIQFKNVCKTKLDKPCQICKKIFNDQGKLYGACCELHNIYVCNDCRNGCTTKQDEPGGYHKLDIDYFNIQKCFKCKIVYNDTRMFVCLICNKFYCWNCIRNKYETDLLSSSNIPYNSNLVFGK